MGALTLVNALMSKGEANLVGVVVNTSSQYSAGCAAAINTYFGHPNVPIGITFPVNTNHSATPDYIFPCSQFPQNLNYASIPSALSVYRQALASQPDGSVVIVAIGFEGRLSELLNSLPDSASPLNGHDLIARKVKMLVAMGGGYPSRSSETNFSGDPAAAANVANNWPTKIVYSGYEIGVNVWTGHTLSSMTPANSPVRRSYEVYDGAGMDNPSWDLTAAYHAIRPGDSIMTETGPGFNSINSGTGGNTWVGSSNKNQYYLQAASSSAIANAFEPLLAYNPLGTPASPTATATAISSLTASPTPGRPRQPPP